MARDQKVPAFIEPMLLQRVGVELPASGWAWEPKWDGCRAQLRAVGGVITLRTRYGRDVTALFPEIAPIAAVLPDRVVLDAELICCDPRDGGPDFERLRPRLSMERPASIAAAAATRPARLIVFDVLHLDGASTCALPYRARRELLEALQLRGAAWETTLSADRALVDATRELGLEGVVAKRLDAPYLPGRRSSSWLKLKHRRRSTLLVTSWQPARGSRPEAFLLRWPDGAPAGAVDRAIAPSARGQLRAAAAAATIAITRTGAHRLRPHAVHVDVDHHGRDGHPVRDPSIAADACIGLTA